VSERYDMLDSMGYADILTNLGVDLTMHSLIDNTLNGHIFDDVFQRNVEGNHILVVFYNLGLFFKETGLLQDKLFVKSDSLNVFLQNGYKLKI
jgi:hypothetical protein